MPGMEVFTISGVDPTTGVYHADAPAASSASPVLRLQNALKALGTAAGDSQLMAIGYDGIVGPQTVKLTNYALAHFVGSTPGFPSANLTAMQVRQSAAVLADRIEARTRASGGTVPTPPAVTARRRISRAPAIQTKSQSSDSSDHRWVFWVVGGVSVLVLLSVATAALKKRRQEAHA